MMNSDVPADAACIEHGCTLDAVTIRPITLSEVLTSEGVYKPTEDWPGVEWVCSIHAVTQ